MYPTLTEVDLFAKCVEDGNYTVDFSSTPGAAVGIPYMYKNTIMWAINNSAAAWDAGSSGDIVLKVRLEAKKTGESSYTTAATYNYTSIFTTKNIVVNTDDVFPQSQYTELTSLRISFGLPVVYQSRMTWIWEILNVGNYLTSQYHLIHIQMGAGWNEKVDGVPERYYIPDIRIYESDNNNVHSYDEFHSAIACRNDLLRFSSVSDHFSSIKKGTKVVTPVIKTDEYGIPSMVIDVGEGTAAGSIMVTHYYYLKLNTKIPTTLKVGQAVRYTDLKDDIIIESRRTVGGIDPDITYYKITWNANGGQYQSETITRVNAGSAISSSEVSMPYACKAGYYFLGWYTAPSGGTQISSSTIPTGDVTYYARYATYTATTTNGSNRVTCDSAGNVFLANDTY